MKIYKLLIDSAEMPKGTEARWNEKENDYSLFSPDGKEAVKVTIDDDGTTVTRWLSLEPWQVENRPTFWQLIEEKKEVENEYRAFVPKHKEEYYFLNIYGGVENDINDNSPYDMKLIGQGVYRTKRSAQMEAKRRESRAKAWMPSEYQVYYYVHMNDKRIYDRQFNKGDMYDTGNYMMGNCHKDEHSAQKWKDDGYWEAFNCLF